MHFHGIRVTNFEFRNYPNGNQGLQLWSDMGPLATASVNPYDVKLAEGEIAIKDYSENEGMLDFLVSNHIVSEPIRTIQIGWAEVPICRVL